MSLLYCDDYLAGSEDETAPIGKNVVWCLKVSERDEHFGTWHAVLHAPHIDPTCGACIIAPGACPEHGDPRALCGRRGTPWHDAGDDAYICTSICKTCKHVIESRGGGA